MRSVMDTFLNNEPGERVALVPLMEPLAARVGGMSYQAMSGDPGQWSANLAKVGQLLEADALVVGFDHTLLAEACGVQVQWREGRPLVAATGVLRPAADVLTGRLAVVLETLDRLCQTVRNDFCCVAAMSGPFTLAADLGLSAGEVGELKPVMVEIARALCDKRPDLLLLREGPAICEGDIGMTQRKAFNTLCNVARYFNIPTALYVEGYTRNTLAGIDKLKMDFYFFGEAAEGALPEPGWFLPLAERVRGIGVALPFDNESEAMKLAEDCSKILAGRNVLFTSAGELAHDTDLDVARKITVGLKSLCRRSQ